jgi:hypothetical protein
MEQGRIAMRNIFAFLAAAALIAVCGCGDKTTNYYNRTDTGTIYGSVSPVDSGAVRAIGDKVYEVRLTGLGTFQLDNLPPRFYQLEILPLNHSKRMIQNVAVESGTSSGLSRIALVQYPYPIYKTAPVDGAGSATGSGITLYVDEILNVADLDAGTYIDPPVDEFHWSVSSYYDSGYDYDYSNSSAILSICSMNVTRNGVPGFRIGTTYHVTIDSTVRTAAGVPLGKTLRFSFRSKPLSVQVILPRYSLTGLVSISSFSPSLKFSTCVDPDSANKALRFEPPIAGVWLPSVGSRYEMDCSGTPNNFYYRFFQTGVPPLASTNYRLIVDDVTKIIDGVAFLQPDTTEFLTDAYGVEAASPANGVYHVAPDQQIALTFNTIMDTMSIQSAFKVERQGGEAVSGEFSWPLAGRQMVFSHAAQLFVSQGVYRITVLRSAKTAGGVYLEKDFVSYFAVE